MTRTPHPSCPPSPAVIVLAVLAALLLLPLVGQATWTEPPGGTYAPAGNLPPALTTGSTTQTLTGNLTVLGGISSRTLDPAPFASSSPFRATGGRTLNVTATAIGATGESSPDPSQRCTGNQNLICATDADCAAVGAGTCEGALQPGVYGIAGSNSQYSIGIKGQSGSNSAQFAGYFSGPTGVEGALTVWGNAQVDGYATFGSPTFNPDTGNGIATVALRAGFVGGNLVGSVNNGVAGDGLSGALSGVTCAAGAVCAGVYGADGSTYTTAPGIWAGYFAGNVYITGTLTDGTGPITAPTGNAGVSGYDPTQFSTVPSVSLLGTYPGLSTPLALVVDGQGIWEGVRQRFRLSNGEPFFSITNPPNSGTAGGILYDGDSIILFDGASGHRYYILNAGPSYFIYLDSGAAIGYSFPTRHEPYFAGESVWAVACNGSSARLFQIRRGANNNWFSDGFDVNLPENPSTPSCIENTKVQGAVLGGTPYVWVSHEHDTLFRVNYANYQSPTLESTHTFPKPFADHVLVNGPGGPGWWYAGGYLWVNQPATGGAVAAGDTVLKVDPLTWATVATYTGHADWFSDDGTWLWMIEEPTRILRTLKMSDGTAGPTKTLTGTNKLGQIVFDGTAFWIQGTGTDTNLYKYLR